MSKLNSKSVTFVIDMLNGFTYEGPLASSVIAEVIDPIQNYLKDQENIFFICDSHSETDIEMQQYPNHCIAGSSESLVVPELNKFITKNNIIKKHTTNGFFTTPKSLLRKFDEYNIVGCCTDICVLQFALTLKMWLNHTNQDKKVNVIKNCVATFDLPNHNAKEYNDFALKLMQNAGIIIK
ncbi:cysteine hydrolase family protein [Mycoplasma leonicaptivi]|uniref:cysteine hydrolase family protein n=1 Tax=Mycoplasma leonicaptivi TaxID=36742 RepID=UPI00048193B3|nr:isochorismatase family cysteine hydrolase [Mycoplasma leonicaptivi]